MKIMSYSQKKKKRKKKKEKDKDSKSPDQTHSTQEPGNASFKSSIDMNQ
jgi:hypothetical protein